MTSVLRLVTRSRSSVHALFAASLSIDEHLASMRHSGERAVSGVTSGTIALGESVTWSARHFGIRFRMTSRVTALERPHRFVDEQVRGPFRVLHHEHLFAEDGPDTVMTDVLTLASPVFGIVAERLVLVPYLRRLIRRRNAHLLRRLGGSLGTEPRRLVWPAGDADRHRRFEATTLLGHGPDVWARATHDVLRWRVKTRSGFAVPSDTPVVTGAVLAISARAAGITVREPVEVVDVVTEHDRVGFSYRTLPGHPVDGEEAFVVHRRGDDVFLTIRSLTAPASELGWRMLYPVLRVAQRTAQRRYLRALR